MGYEYCDLSEENTLRLVLGSVRAKVTNICLSKMVLKSVPAKTNKICLGKSVLKYFVCKCV